MTLPPGEGKSPVFSHATAPIRDYEHEERKRVDEERAAIRVAHDVAAKRRKDLTKRAATEKNDAARNELLEKAKTAAAEESKTRVPTPPRYLANDATAEALAELMHKNGGRMAVLSAEAGPFEIMKGKYDSGPSLELYLQGHSGDFLATDRITRKGSYIRKPILTLAMTVQPVVIAGLLDRPEFRGRGLCARFLYVMPQSRVGKRNPDPEVMKSETVWDYTRVVTALLRLEARMDDDGEFRSLAIPLSPDAWDEIVGFKMGLEARLGPEGDLAPFADWVNKLPGAVIRLAGILHVARIAGAGAFGADQLLTPIGRSTVLDARRLGEYFIEHARAAFGVMGGDPAEQDAKIVLAWIRRKQLPIITSRQVQRGCGRRLRAKEAVERALDCLGRKGYLKVLDCEKTAGPGRPPGVRYNVNPLAPVSEAESRTGDYEEAVSDAIQAGGGVDSVDSVAAAP